MRVCPQGGRVIHRNVGVIHSVGRVGGIGRGVALVIEDVDEEVCAYCLWDADERGIRGFFCLCSQVRALPGD